MIRILLICSIVFSLYGFYPYKKAWNIDTSIPNHLVIGQNECGCPCPDDVLKGKLHIPPEINAKYGGLDERYLNLQFTDSIINNNMELWYSNLYVKGKVIGVDTIYCSGPGDCQLAPRFLVEEWHATDNVITASSFEPWAMILFGANLLLFFPILLIIEIVRLIRRKKIMDGKDNFN